MQTKEDDLFILQKLLSVNQIKTSAYFFNTKRHLLALVLGTGGIVIYGNLENQSKPILRWIPWFEDGDKTIQSLCFQPSSGAWIVVVCYDGSLYVLPVAWLIDFESIGLLSTPEWMSNDVTFFPPVNKDFIPTSISWWESKIASTGNFAIVGGKAGKLQLRNLSNGTLVGQTSVSGDISSVAVFTEKINVTSVLLMFSFKDMVVKSNHSCDSLLLLHRTVMQLYQRTMAVSKITNEQNEQWKLLLENQEIIQWPSGTNSSRSSVDDQLTQTPVFPSARVRLQGLKQLSVETMANIRQKITENKNRSVANSLKRKDSSSSSASDDIAVKFKTVPTKIDDEVWFVSPGYNRSHLTSEPLFHVYNIPGNVLKVKKPKHSYKLPPSDVTTVGLSIYTDFFLFITNSAATQLTVLASKLMENDKSQEYNPQSFIQKTKLGDDEWVQALYRVSCFKHTDRKERLVNPSVVTKSLPVTSKTFLPSINLAPSNKANSSSNVPIITPDVFETCLVITNKSVYLLNLKDHPSSCALKLLNSDDSFERVEWLTKVFCLDRQGILVSAANLQLMAGNSGRAISFLKLAKASPLECALRLASAGLVEQLIMYITSLTHLDLSPPERRRLAEICILAFVEQILRSSDKSKYLKKFLKLLNEDLYYRECYAVQTVGKCYLFSVLKYFLCDRGLLEDVADVIEMITAENSIKFLELHEGFWDVLTDRSLTNILICKKSFAMEYMKLIQTNLCALPVETLQRLCQLFDPTRSCFKPLIKTMFLYVTSNHKPREIINQSKYLYSTDIGVEVNFPIENWITLFVLTLLHLLHKTHSTNFNFDVLNVVSLKYVAPAKEMLLKTSNKVVLSAGLAHSAVILKKSIYTWGQDRHSCLGRRSVSIIAQADTVPWFMFPKVDVHSVACGRHHTLVLTSNGVYSWGLSNYGQLGIPGLKKSPNPCIIETLSQENVVFIAAGQYHSLAISANGYLWTWGWGVHGQLGHGSIEDISKPTVVSRLICEVIIQAAGGYAHSVALTAKGRVFVFGSSCFGQLGIGSPVKRTVPIEVYGLSEPINQIASGYFHNLALSKVGRLYVWGSSPQVLRSQTQAQKRSRAFTTKSSFKPEEDEFTTKFSCDDINTMENNGNTSKNDFLNENLSSPHPPNDQINLQQNLNLSLDPVYPSFETRDASSPDDSATHLSPMLVDTSNVMAKIVAISCGCHHSAILDEKGTVYTWGKNFDGQLGDGTRKAVSLPTPIQISNQLKLSSDNLILHVPLSTIPVQYVCCGADFTLAMESGGRIWGWGSNQNGQLGTLPTPDESDFRVKIRSSSNRRVVKVPYGSPNNIIDSPQLVPIIAYQHFPAFPENKSCTSVVCPIYLPFETVQHNILPLSTVENSRYGVLSLHYILECFHNCYNVELIKSVCVELENYQALAKIQHLNKSYCAAFMNHLKALILTSPESVDVSSVDVISNSRKTLKSFVNRTANMVTSEVIIPNLTADMIVKSKSENFINTCNIGSSSLEKMNVSESRDTSKMNGEKVSSLVKMEISENRTWIQSDDTLEEQSSITSMSNSDLVNRSENTNSLCNNVEEVSKKLSVSINCDDLYSVSSPDSSSSGNKDHLSLCDDEIDANSYFSKLQDTDRKSYQTCDKSESSSVGILDCVSNDEEAEIINNGPKCESDNDSENRTYEEESLNRLNVLNSLNSEIKDILMGTANPSFRGISYVTEPLSLSNGINTNTYEVDHSTEDVKLAQNALELLQFYLEIMKKASKTEFLHFLHKSISSWIAHRLPMKHLESLFESQWDDYVNYLGIILVCGVEGNPDYSSTQQMLHLFSLKFNLKICLSLVESVSDKDDLHPELVKLLANTLAAPNVGSRLHDKRSYEELLTVTLSKLKGEIPLQPFINIEPSVLHNEITAFSCGHRFSNSGTLQYAVSKAASELEDQNLSHISHQLRDIFDQPLIIRKFACPECISSFFLSKNISS